MLLIALGVAIIISQIIGLNYTNYIIFPLKTERKRGRKVKHSLWKIRKMF